MQLSFGKIILLINVIFVYLSLEAQEADYVNIIDSFDSKFFKFNFSIENDILTIENEKGHLKLKVGFEYGLSSIGYYIYIEPILLKDGEILITKKALMQIENHFKSLQTYSKPRITSIVIDPGHGGHDRGAVVTHRINEYDITLLEKDFSLTYSMHLYKILSNYFLDRNILLTRVDDVFVPLKDRSELANAIKPDFPNNVIFLSIHVNNAPNPKARGIEFWYLPQDSKREVIKNLKGYDVRGNRYLRELNDILDIKYKYESRKLAEILYETFIEVVCETRVRSIREEQWFVIKNSSMPAVLIEIGFLSNIYDAMLILDYGYMSKINILVLESLIKFIEFYEK
ncbi:N-acetylmuramoyl-L-alanine amidase [Borrelia miyamotoi]|uniref:N-acetylmuramoyl-L-alanine amidase n=1 Tax=Borrelia miyamotoi TaxID=47466 RepID=A0AAX3JLU1_9SPIR|nr:N-acetylmuramoyl-L-alanine amidase [Borrelia miyamotoi]QFP41705.1 N-acetylmuramoyl-L-alanine amidase [Borrelia miyamotoi]QFP47825.1 N-acetylmuramoyl-L-alanine amidase [Borrelia miyamotoi]QGT55585.1 N-acetylmuramoyl-L-alanine amidase [Borrelia miyamotoi]QGT56369.1 N-acetylmuramoyl-L-alanine amidase [Borrelia miyamotoi]WAZ71614.1 N-acetylmuramoyl-L-alanine amidase [Borrelia miyamotoi]